MGKKKMKAILKARAAPGLEWAEVDVPTIGPREVLIRVIATSICGTDVHIFDWDAWSQSRVKPPLILGHEFAGEIVEVGEEADTEAYRAAGIRPGAFVSAEGHIVDNTCFQCRTGNKHICQNVSVLGIDRPGTYAEYVAVPVENVWVNPPDLPPEIASLQDPLGNAVHAALAQEIVGKTVLVTGCGPIGLMAIPVCLAAGAAAVFATDVRPQRLELARRLKATRALNPLEEDVHSIVREATGGEGVDVLLEMSGSKEAMDQGFGLLKNGGAAALLGLPSRPFAFDWGKHVIFKGVTVRGIFGRRIWQTWYQMRELLASGRLELSPLITHRLRLEEFAQGFALLKSREQVVGKVVMFP
jgi:threonine 3-dehydrogenase